MTGGPEQQAPARDAWGPRDWCANGIGGDFSRDIGEDIAGDIGEGVQDPGPGPGPERESDPGPGSGSRRRGQDRGQDRSRGRRRGWGGESASEREGAVPEKPADPAAQARALCLRLLTGSPRTRKQLADAMRKRGLPEEVVEEVLGRYEEVGLIDDAAFADAWVESRHRGRGLARRALAMELRSRGVDNAVVAEAVSQLDPEQEADTARELVERKLRSTRGLDRQVRIRRLAGMLARRGYSEGLALRVVRAALDAEQAEEPEEYGESGEFREDM